MADGARASELARLLGVGLTTLQRWRRQFAGDGNGLDDRKGSHRHVAHRLSEEERQRILLTCNEPEFAELPPGQIVPVLADRGLYVGSERSLYRVLHTHRRGRAPTGAQTGSTPAGRRSESGVGLGHHLSPHYRPGDLAVPLPGDRRLEPQSGGLGIAEREDPAIAADLVSRACLRERISKGRRRPLILHADNGNAMRAATLESRLEELGVITSFSRPRVLNDNPYSESLFRTAKYRPDYPSRPFTGQGAACQ